ncbi:tryptophan-rich sensory protein [Enterococcus sp. 5H]|uniref:tryptophan-rich sensory protein n=1 Tax=Enterococcus sp. 5H TaxID=1229490 RepID=UPI0023043201|nr:tryptophan-rich sensory protein [Enterococcus sp. 5H]MDA9470180.1 hypothetical protein [Enterococcus sp. 5H]
MNLTKSRKWMVTLFYFVMIGTNAAAVLLPLNGVSTQEVSNTYGNLFAPAGVTFSIWSVIYLLLAGFVIYQWQTPDKQSILADTSSSNMLRIIFILSSILNSVWLVLWQYFHINLSVIVMLFLLISLIYVNQLLANATLTKKDYILVRLPFSIYFGWITIATIANITAFFVDKDIAFLQDNQPIWTVIILIIGVVIISVTIIKNHDIAYGIATLWAYLGILLEHQAQGGWNHKYPIIINTVFVSLIVIVCVCLYVLALEVKKKNNK